MKTKPSRVSRAPMKMKHGKAGTLHEAADGNPASFSWEFGEPIKAPDCFSHFQISRSSRLVSPLGWFIVVTPSATPELAVTRDG